MKTFIIYKNGEVDTNIEDVISRYTEPHDFSDVLMVGFATITNGGIGLRWRDADFLQELLKERLEAIAEERAHDYSLAAGSEK